MQLKGRIPMYIYTAEQIRHIDAEAEQLGLNQFTLMENAGRGVFEQIQRLVEKDKSIGIVAGQGNNGGDGIVLARYLHAAGYTVSLMFPLGEPISEVAKAHLSYYLSRGYSVSQWDETMTCDVIIDALLGIGTRLPLPKQIIRIIAWANNQRALRIAIDLPTGVLADYGNVEEDDLQESTTDKTTSFHADYTFSLHGVKPSAFLYPSSYYYGKLEVVPIGLEQINLAVNRKDDSTSNAKTKLNYQKSINYIKVISEEEVRKTLPNRHSSSHKGTFGTSLIVAGSDEMPGSVALSAIGSIRSGTGRLIIGTSKEVIPIVAAHVPEATFIANGLEKIANGEIPEKIAATAIGPGLTDTELTQKALNLLMKLPIPIVVDAGALEKRSSWSANGPVIITPHPGEFSRLTGHDIRTIQQNRIELAVEFSQKHKLIVVLKGEYTVIAFPTGRAYINQTGNTGLAKGGSGDVLTGILVSFLATHDNVERAVVNAVYVHGLCANEWAKKYSEASMTASDFAKLLPQVLKKLETD